MSANNSNKGIQLKNVIHFYIGCEVTVTDLPFDYDGTLLGIDRHWENECRIQRKDAMAAAKPEECKLHLRPLLSMTNDECEEFGMMYEMGEYNPEVLEFDSRIGATTYFLETETAAARFVKLLQAHFDLFGLIGSNQAIDKTLLPK